MDAGDLQAGNPAPVLDLTDPVYPWGRIFVAANHSAGPPQKHFTDYRAHGFYTDDHGKHFQLGAEVNLPGGNENMAVELSNNRLMLNFRNQKGDVRNRVVAISSNGGTSWDTVYFDPRLPDPVCQGSILAIGNRNGKNVIAFCNNADTIRRDNLTLRISYDEGKTWKKNFIIEKPPLNYRGDFTAYSDITKMSKHQIAVLYEMDSYKEIVFTVIDWSKI